MLHFRSFSKIKVDNHAFNKENLPSHFKVKEYCPLVFRNLRDRFGIDDHSYLRSIVGACPHRVDSPGKSGAKFYQVGTNFECLSETHNSLSRKH